MQIKYIAHSCFYLACSDPFVEVIFDPYKAGVGGINYAPVNMSVNAVFVSHQHQDHNAVEGIADDVHDRPGRLDVSGIEFRGTPCFHDAVQGKERGPNIMWTTDMENVRLTHMGDLGHMLSDKEMKEIKGTEVLFAPVGGPPTLDLPQMIELWQKLKVKVVIPMHYKTAKCQYPKYGLDELEKLMPKSIKKIGGSEVFFMGGGSLPRNLEVWELDPMR